MKFPEKESSLIEFAASIPTNDQIIQTTIGFCNSHGGKLIVGVAKNGTIVGIPENKIEVLMECLKQCIYDASCPPIISTVYSQRIGDKMVLIVLVPAGMNKPYFKKSEGLDKGTYIRFGRSTVKANADMIKDLQRQSQCRSFDMMSIHDAKLTDLDEKRIKVFLTREHKETDAIPNSILFANDLIIRENTSHYPTAGGILLFGKNPQKYFPGAITVCSHFTSKNDKTTISAINFTGTLFEQFDKAYSFIINRLERSFSGNKRKKPFEISHIAIREVLLNALVHRNYYIQDPLKIAIYDNRIEFFSPGAFAGPLDATNLKMSFSYIRNKIIYNTFRKAGYMGKWSSGFISLFDSYEKRGLQPPLVIEGVNYIQCILPRQVFANPLAFKDREQQQVLDLFITADKISISDIIKVLEISRATAGRRLAQLNEQGFLEQIGQGKATRYRRKK